MRLLSSIAHIFLTPGSCAAPMRLPLPVPALPGRMQPAANQYRLSRGYRLHTALFQHRKGCDFHEFIQQVHIHRMYQVYGEAQGSRLLPGDPVYSVLLPGSQSRAISSPIPSCSEQKHCKQYCKRIIVCHLNGESRKCSAQDHSQSQNRYCSCQPYVPSLVHTYFSHREEISTQIIQEIHTAIRQYRNTVDVQYLIQKRCHTAS